jgi:hypothetical protein
MSTPSLPVPPSADGADESTSSSSADRGVAVDVQNVLVPPHPTMKPANVCSNWSFGESLEVLQPTIFSVNTQQRLAILNSLKSVVLRSTMIVILHDRKFTLKFPALRPEGPSPTLSFSGEGTVEWENPCDAASAESLSTNLLVSSGILFRAHDMDMFRFMLLGGVHLELLNSMTVRGDIDTGDAVPDMKILSDNFVGVIKAKTFAFMCGSGVAHSICREAPTWHGFVDEYARITKILLDENDAWLQEILEEQSLIARADLICRHLNRGAPINGTTEIHRLIAQMIFNRLNVSDPSPAVVLHRFNSAILVTNYDTLLEQAISNVLPAGQDRVTVSHVEYMNIENPLTFNVAWGPGRYFASPLSRLVIHVHGRYFDVGAEHGFCLTQAEYENEHASRTFLRFMHPLAARTSLVFVGASGTWLDLHFQSLWMSLQGSEVPHFILSSYKEYAKLLHNAQFINRLYTVNIIVVPFYDVDETVDPALQHANLWLQLERLRRHCGL